MSATIAGRTGEVDVVLHQARRAWTTMRLHPVQMAYALTTVAVTWFVARLMAPISPVVVGWLPGLLTVVLVVVTCVSTARRPGTPRGVTQFWFAIAAAAACVGVGTVLRALHGLDGAAARTLAVPDMIAYLLAMLIIGWALLRLPLGLTDVGQRWRFWLDMSTVMAGTALFFWYFSVRPSLGIGNDDQAVLTGLVVSALALVLVFAVAKVVMAGAATIDPGALRALGLGLLVGTIGSAPEPLLPVDGPSTGQLVVPITTLLAVVAATRQHRAQPAMHATPAAPTRHSRRFSLLPYSAVAASGALLLYTAVHGGPVDRATVAGAVVCLVGLVISRQVLAFADNTRLVTQLDAGLAVLAAREQRFRALVRNSSDFITITGRDGLLTYVSPGAIRVLGLEPSVWTGRRAADLIHPDDLHIVTERFLGIKDVPGATAVYEARLRHADGSWRLVEASTTNLMDDPAVDGIVGNARDITEQNAFRQRLQHQADHDALTGLANRSLFQRRMREALTDPATPHVSALLVDLNDFKILNDTLGHIAGDEMIVGVAQRLLDAAPADATVARLGGDEFAILVTDRAGADGFVVATEILDALIEPVDVCGYRTPLSASIGVAVAEPDLSADELLRRADVAMYAAKAARDGASSRWAGYTEELDRPLLDRAELEAQLRVAIDDGQLRLLYQPIVSARTGAVTNVEALVRWVHPHRGLLPPAQFVPLAERSSLILELGRWTLAEACRQAGRWYRRHGSATPGMSVNVSARQLHDPTFTDHVAATLATTGLPAHLLTIEITETTAVHANAVELIRALHDLGVRVSLDDFGTGHSSLSLLQSCPADEVKLDRSFTRTAVAAGRRSVAVAVIELTTALGLDVVAEGVETAAEADCLAALGYDRLQGFHFAHPGHPDEIDVWIERTRTTPAAV
jgi:diguanylate cyclase (GGDEF)-like protein/PAS domain S-box-containing protein